MEQREKDIQLMCKAVLEIGIIFYDNPNGAYESNCPFCNAEELRGGGGNIWADMDELNHDLNCAYLIAKDLSTNTSKEVTFNTL